MAMLPCIWIDKLVSTLCNCGCFSVSLKPRCIAMVYFQENVAILGYKSTAESEPTRRWASKECVISMELKAMGLGELYMHTGI